jgi:phenylalanyl-tRNA synthetase beta chain
VALFEVGQTYRGEEAEDQFMVASGIRSGAASLTGSGRHWSSATPAVGLYEAKADAAALLAALGFDASKARVSREAPSWFHPGRSGIFRLGPKIVIAHFGEIHPETLRAMDVAGPVAAFEVFLEALPAEKRKSLAKGTLHTADLLPVRRDFAFVLDKQVTAADVIKAATAADRKLIAGVNVFDVFEDASLGEGKKSLALEVTLLPAGKTLTDQEIEAVCDKLVQEVRRTTGGQIRK